MEIKSHLIMLRVVTFCTVSCFIIHFCFFTAGYLQLAESKLKALSVAVRLKQPDKRFESIKNYGNELQVHLNCRKNEQSCHIIPQLR
jgi:hypothetical protein